MEKSRQFVLTLFVLMVVFIGAMVAILNDAMIPLSDRVFGGHIIYVHGDTPIYVDIAETDEERQIGLGKRKVMAAGEGMLFKFDEDGKWRVWMKDMEFGIDILWLDKDGKVVDIKEFVYPDTYPSVFEPAYNSRYILEVLTGYTSANSIIVGHKIDLNW